MVIDCTRCELRGLECGDCLVTMLADGARPAGGAGLAAADGTDGTGGCPPGRSASRRALGAQELRALAALAGAGLVPPLRFRPIPSAATAVIVALLGLVRGVIRQTGVRLAEPVESAKCLHYGHLPARR